jgi:hypothetical protein
MNEDELQCLRAAYVMLLGLPHGALRLRLQPVLATLRDGIAAGSGRIDRRSAALKRSEQMTKTLLTTVVDRLDRVLVTDADGQRFVLSRTSAVNLYCAMLECIKAEGYLIIRDRNDPEGGIPGRAL